MCLCVMWHESLPGVSVCNSHLTFSVEWLNSKVSMKCFVLWILFIWHRFFIYSLFGKAHKVNYTIQHQYFARKCGMLQWKWNKIHLLIKLFYLPWWKHIFSISSPISFFNNHSIWIWIEFKCLHFISWSQCCCHSL